MSLRKRAAKPLIARRAFLSLTFIQATLHACIPACDFTFSEIQSYYSLFLQFFAFASNFSTDKECTPVRSLFALCSRDCAFFSVNSAQIQECQHIRIKFYAFILQYRTSLCMSALYTSHQTFLCYSYYKEAEYYTNHLIHRHKAKPYGQSVQILHLHNPIRLINLFHSIHTYFGLYILPHFSPI